MNANEPGKKIRRRPADKGANVAADANVVVSTGESGSTEDSATSRERIVQRSGRTKVHKRERASSRSTA